METVTLRPIDSANWVACVELQTTPEQEQAGYVSPNVLSLAQAYAERWWNPLGIYAGDTLVGFLMYGCWPEHPLTPEWGKREPGIHHILRLMVDRRWQGRGYARAALQALIERVESEPGVTAIEVNADPNNIIVLHLFEGLGFLPTGVMDDGEIRSRLTLLNNCANNLR